MKRRKKGPALVACPLCRGQVSMRRYHKSYLLCEWLFECCGCLFVETITGAQDDAVLAFNTKHKQTFTGAKVESDTRLA